MAIVVDDVTVKYKNKISLEHINLVFERNEQWAIYGPNGAGKSTLLKTIIGLIKPDEGQVILSNLKPSQVTYLSQSSGINTAQPLNVFELVALGLWYEISFYKGLSKEQENRVYTALEQVGLIGLEKKQISELSRGQLQRALFARILVQNADYFLLDEPFNAMDHNTTVQLLDFLSQAKENQKTVIAVIHDQKMIQDYFPNTVILDVNVKYQGPINLVDFKLLNKD
ncbi:MAG: metal ABC transporter ATP-binding protein [Neisseriaceae bacterium]|nr:ATP-binding cassette domain-containing protein [Neisseriaceae bacterium PsAf]MCV2503482.1 metal ABC transporter ATP-binding protein [Neisseriaceae bacterium]MCV2508941.1 metal ABC transporter ATP-binding protein [Neisseriaceae bacterium]